MTDLKNSNIDTAEWIGVSDIEQHGIEEAIKEMNGNKGIANEQVMVKMKNKYILA